MLRCAVLAAAASVALPAAADVQPRTFPATALRGELVVVQPPEVLLNGHAARLAPGARIFDENGMLQMSGALAGRKLTVHYTRDLAGQPLTVWVLTRDELANRPWPANDDQAQTWTFDAAAQKWTRK